MSRPSHLPSLDAMRGAAITLTMLLHFKWLELGWVGVQAFFVLSGYLITDILLREKERPLGVYLKRFYWRRTLRIFPLYFGFLFVMGAVFALFGVPAVFGENAPYLFTYTYNFRRLSADWVPSGTINHFWSLCVEEQFYLAWPMVVFFLPLRRLRLTLALAAVIAPVVRALLGAALIGRGRSAYAVADAVYWFPLSHLDAFAAGAAITVFALDQKVRHPLRIASIATRFALVVGAVNLAVRHARGIRMSVATLGFPFAGFANYEYVWSYSVLNLCFAAWILALVARDRGASGERRALPVRMLIAVGKVSYGMYVMHWIVLALLHRLGVIDPLPRVVAFPLYFSVVFLVAWFVYEQYESRFLALKDRLDGR